MTGNDFRSMGLGEALLRGLAEMGYEHPTEVQALAIPLALAGKDLMVQSRTGTGKTAAYGIPAAMRTDPARKEVQFLTLTPTRELALQVTGDLTRLNAHTGIHVTCIYGGASYSKQASELRAGAQMVVGTPGRILDHLVHRTLSLAGVRLLVLDEADRMLDMGFYEEISRILACVPRERQTLLCSATFPISIRRLAQSHQRNPEMVALSDDSIYVREVEHRYYITRQMEKDRDLYRLMEIERPGASIIFCNTKDEVRMVYNTLRRRGLDVAMLTGDLQQVRREQIMASFRLKKVRHLVTTDVASRGIDVEDVTHIFLYSSPQTPEDYIHRAGRTGRMGKSGVAISLVAAGDLLNFNRLVNAHHLEVVEGRMPTDEDVAHAARGRLLDRIRVLEDKLAAEELEEMESLARDLLDQEDVLSLIEVLLHRYLASAEGAEPAEPEAPAEPTPAYEEAPESRPADEAPGRSRRRRQTRPRR